MTNNPLCVALDILDPAIGKGEDSQRLTAAKCRGLLVGYDKRWKNAPYRIDDVECVLQSDLYNSETGKKSRTFRSAGKLDVRATEINTGRKVIFDHKTTSQDISDPGAPYWLQLVIEGQVSHYMLLEWLNGNKVDCGVWDVIRKPGISPKAIAKKDMVEIFRNAEYFDEDISDEDLSEIQETGRETLRMYSARLAFDCSMERPEWYFQRKEVPRLDEEIKEYAIDQWDEAQNIISARKNQRYPRSSGSCMAYGSACEYLGICTGHDNFDSGNWEERAWVHPELPIIDGSKGTEILTNSRIRCFQSCRRKHYYKYEMGMVKIDAEEKAALFFGNLFHQALEAYFLTLKQNQQKGITS